MKETDHFVPRFSFVFIRPIFHEICHFFLRAWNRKTSRISKIFYRKTVARIRVVFWSISHLSSKIIFKRGTDQLFSYPLVKFPCFQTLQISVKHLNRVKEIDLKKIAGVCRKSVKYFFNNRSIISDILDIPIGELNSNIMKNLIYNQKTQVFFDCTGRVSGSVLTWC